MGAYTLHILSLLHINLILALLRACRSSVKLTAYPIYINETCNLIVSMPPEEKFLARSTLQIYYNVHNYFPMCGMSRIRRQTNNTNGESNIVSK